jgi:hypothetical protein
MPLDHSKATATVSVTGVAISCLNETTHNWEVGLVRVPRHELRITVAKVLPSGEVAQVTFQLDDNRHSIFITAANEVIPEQPLFQKEPFGRKNPDSDPEDIRWIVDLEREFNNEKPLELTAKFPMTGLLVSHPTLYADSDKLRKEMKLLNLADPNEQPTEFGTLSEACKADIVCKEGGGVILRVEGPLGFSMLLPHIPGATHGIRIENDCPPKPKAAGANGTGTQPATNGHERTDFNLYFDIVKFGAGVNFDLSAPEGIHGSDAVCNPAFMGSRGSLLPVG